ncbi:cytochrome P450 [Catellatospora bangladeshensis]|uniref:Cytochrome P450 n=1 Tax=Catellatospora bangladeshensis TaxID=310355 RepID=A0A8J3NPX8_9ACTN|nr:cytochrome P450 [Catellatospora bangladeshensis]GIF86435.1 cytochrome P450 [Catellatospora bangladeshensis]
MPGRTESGRDRAAIGTRDMAETPPPSAPTGTRIAFASPLESARVLGEVLLPTVAQGVILRRPAAVTAAAALETDRRAVRLLQRLRERHDADALALRLNGRDVVLLLTPRAATRVLEGTPVPYRTATVEKRASLAHFQPTGVLISDGPLRAERRAFNEAVLETDLPVHRLADQITAAARQEMSTLVTGRDRLEWPAFSAAFERLVRRIVLGDGARTDVELTNLLAALRRDANWAYLRPRRGSLLHRFRLRLATHLDRAEPGSLAALLAEQRARPGVDPYGQVPHWLFAYDAAAATAFRTLALLSTHAKPRLRLRDELAALDEAAGPHPYLSACVLDTVRLWPTTLAILRESTAVTMWGGTPLPRGTSFVIYSPLLNRDTAYLPGADGFQPELWLGDTAGRAALLVPFSAGPAVCPGRSLVLQTVTAALAALLREHDFRLLARARLDEGSPLPHTFGHMSIGFTITPAWMM